MTHGERRAEQSASLHSLVEGLVLYATLPEVLAGFWCWGKVGEDNFLFLQQKEVCRPRQRCPELRDGGSTESTAMGALPPRRGTGQPRTETHPPPSDSHTGRTSSPQTSKARISPLFLFPRSIESENCSPNFSDLGNKEYLQRRSLMIAAVVLVLLSLFIYLGISTAMMLLILCRNLIGDNRRIFLGCKLLCLYDEP